MNKACQLFLVFPGTSSTPFLPPPLVLEVGIVPQVPTPSALPYLDPRVGPQGTWERDKKCHLGVGAAEHRRVYYMGDGVGIPRVRAVVSLVV